MQKVFTARQADNSVVLRDILLIYAKHGVRILDMTYGEGAFWRDIDTKHYDLVTNDLIKPADFNCDFRKMPLPDESFDVIVLDPPYVHGSKTIHKSLARQYGLKPPSESGKNYRMTKHGLDTNWGFTRMPMSGKDITKMYKYGAKEAWRLLKLGGILIIKTQDEIESNKQIWRHTDLRRLPGFKQEDLFVVVQTGKPMMRHKYQKHARKNHSYFMVYRKYQPELWPPWILISTKKK